MARRCIVRCVPCPEAISREVEKLAATQAEFHSRVAKAREEFHSQIAVARAQRVGGAKAAKQAVRTCVAECSRLRAKYPPAMRAAAVALSNRSADRQLSRQFLAHWENLERDAMDLFNAFLDVDEEVAHGGANVDLSALHELIEELRGCGGADACPPLDLGDFLVAKEISLLRRATFRSRLGELRVKPLKVPPTPPGSTVGNGSWNTLGDDTPSGGTGGQQETARGVEGWGTGNGGTPCTSPPPTSVKEEESVSASESEVREPPQGEGDGGGADACRDRDDVDGVGGALVDTSNDVTVTPHRDSHPGEPSSVAAEAHTAIRTLRFKDSPPTSRDALTDAPSVAGSEAEGSEAELFPMSKSRSVAFTTPGTVGLPDGCRWEDEATVRLEVRREVFEEIREQLVKVKGIDVAHLDGIARRLALM